MHVRCILNANVKVIKPSTSTSPCVQQSRSSLVAINRLSFCTARSLYFAAACLNR